MIKCVKMEKFQNKYRIPSARLQNWDYGSNAAYFVTICTKNMEYFFGNIVETPNLGVCTGDDNDDMVETPNLGVSDNTGAPENEMQLSEIGKMADHFWNEIPNHFPFVELDEYIVMPNHVHGILIIDKMDGNGIVETPNLGVSTGNNNDDMAETPNLGVCTGNDDNDGIIADGIAIPATAAASEKWKSATLGVIINQYKRICTIESRKINRYFAWQSRFHDHIIRDAMELERIRNYIVNNPRNWKEDKFYS